MNTLTVSKPPGRTVGIALLGCGTVGRGLVELLHSNGPLIAGRAGADLRLRKVLVRDIARGRNVPDELITDDVDEALSAPGVDIVVELAGGLEPARTWIARALSEGRHVVTANKALLAEHGPELFDLAARHGVSLGFSASVCGAVPVLGAISAGLAGNRIESVFGIVNGTCNYILTRMAEGGASFDDALREAQAAGFAEADPSLDVDGKDAAQKLTVLARVAFGMRIRPRDVDVEGIRHVAPEDVRAATRMDCVVKHVVSAGVGTPFARPVLLSRNHALAGVRNEQNAVLVRGDAAGDMTIMGAGAGGLPTAGSVLADLIEIARGVVASTGGPDSVLSSRPGSDVPRAHYLRFPIRDATGIIGLIGTVLGERAISIRHAHAELDDGADAGNVYLLVGKCSPGAIRAAVGELAGLPVVRGRPVVMPLIE